MGKDMSAAKDFALKGMGVFVFRLTVTCPPDVGDNTTACRWIVLDEFNPGTIIGWRGFLDKKGINIFLKTQTPT